MPDWREYPAILHETTHGVPMFPQAQQASNFPTSTFGNAASQVSGQTASALTRIRDEIDGIAKLAAMFTNEAREIADAAFGSVPTAAAQGGSTPPVFGRVSEAQASVELLREVVSALGREVSRFRAL